MNVTNLTPNLSSIGERYVLSIVVPVFNEEETLLLFHQEIIKQLEALKIGWEIIYIDDGSSDRSRQIIKNFCVNFANISLLCFSRNFGKESAMSAGLRVSGGKCVIIMDADLQDPPTLIPGMIKAWESGADVVNMRRLSRKGESIIKRVTAHLFYRLINKISDVEIPEGIGDFRLLSRRVVDALNQLPESNRFMKGLFSWVGFRQVILEFDRNPRVAGVTKFNYWKLWNFALEGITSFSTAPLKVATYSGLLCALSAFVYALFFLIKTLFVGDPTPGFPTLIIAVLVLGGAQLMAIGLLGEYLGRLFIEAKKRPLYLIDEYIPPHAYAKHSQETKEVRHGS